MALPTVSFTTSYSYPNGIYILTDTSTYPDPLWSVGGYTVGNFKITDPNGLVIWNNTNYAAFQGTAASAGATSIVLTGGDNTTPDYYKNLYVYITAGTGVGQARLITAYNHSTLTATVAAWGVQPDGTSDFIIAFGDLLPVASLTNQGVINLSLGVDGAPVAGNYTVVYTVKDTSTGLYSSTTSTFAFDFVAPIPSLGYTIDCISPQLIAIDTTNYVVDNVTPTISRTHTLYYPPSLNISPITGTATDIATSNFYTPATFQHTLSVDLDYDLGGGNHVLVTLTAQQFINVTCDAQLCDIYCCVATLYNNWKANLGINRILAEKYLSQLVQVASLMTLIKQAIECGKSDAVAGYVSDILRIANCEAGCGCTSDAPVPVTGLGTGTNTITTLTAGNGVTITSTTTGSTTNYIVSISQSTLNTINSLHNQIVTGTISNTVTYDGNTFTYNVAGADFVVSADTYNPSAASLTLTTTQVGGIDTQWSLAYGGRKAGLLFLNETPVATTGNALQDLMTFTPSGLPANTLAVNGDELIIRAYFSFADTATKSARLIAYLDFGSTQAAYSNWSSAIRKCQIEMRVVRIDNTHIKREVLTYVMDANGAVTWASNLNTSATVVVPSLLGNAVTIKTEGDGQATGDISCDYLTIELIPKI